MSILKVRVKLVITSAYFNIIIPEFELITNIHQIFVFLYIHHQNLCSTIFVNHISVFIPAQISNIFLFSTFAGFFY